MLIGKVAAVAAAATTAAAAASGSAAPNVLYLISDDLRPEFGAYNQSAMVTPNVDRLAAEGTLFLRAYCQQAVCGPSRAVSSSQSHFPRSYRCTTSWLRPASDHWRAACAFSNTNRRLVDRIRALMIHRVS